MSIESLLDSNSLSPEWIHYLQHGEQKHWFCPEGEPRTQDLLKELLPVLAISTDVEAWKRLRSEIQMRVRKDECLGCMMGLNNMRLNLEAEGHAVAADALGLDTAERLQGSFQVAYVQMEGQGVYQVSTEMLLSLLEVLAFWQVLVADVDVLEEVLKVIRAMKQKKLEIDVSASGILPGMFVLVAHEDEGIRSFVQRNMLDPLGKQEQSDEFYAIIQMQALIDRWCQTFESGVFEDVYTNLPGKVAYEQQEALLWDGLTSFLKILGPQPMQDFIQQHPQMRVVCIQRVMDLEQPGKATTRARHALQCIRIMLEGVGMSFWRSFPGERFSWTPEMMCSLLEDCLVKITQDPIYMSDFTCKTFSTIVESFYDPVSGRMSDENALFCFKHMHVLLTKVCTGIMLSKQHTKVIQRKRVLIVKRSLWTLLTRMLVNADQNVTKFCSIWIPWLRDALMDIEQHSKHEPQALVITSVWADVQSLLAEKYRLPGIPQEYACKAKPGSFKPVVCPAAWQLLESLANNAWGVKSLLQVATFLSDVTTSQIVSSPVSVVLPTVCNGQPIVALPQGVSSLGHQTALPFSKLEGASAVSSECSQPIQLFDALRDVTYQAVSSLSSGDSLAPAIQEILGCSSDSISRDAMAALVSNLVSAHLPCRNAAESFVINLKGSQEIVHNSDALQKGVSFLLSNECASFMLATFGDHLQRVEAFLDSNKQSSLLQLCQGDTYTVQPVIAFAAPLLVCSMADDDAIDSRLEPIAVTCWSISKAILESMARLDMRAQLSLQCEALLVAALRAMAIVWETHQKIVMDVLPSEVPEALSFIRLLLIVPRYFPHMTRSLSEVWSPSLMTITTDLPAAMPLPSSVREAAVGFLANVDGNIPSFLRKHVASLLGASAPGNMARLAAGQELSDLPAKQVAPAKPVIDLTLFEDTTPPTPKAAAKKAQPDSPLLRAWDAAEARNPAAAAQKAADAGSLHTTFSGGRKLGGLNFARTGLNVGKDVVPPLPKGKVSASTSHAQNQLETLQAKPGQVLPAARSVSATKAAAAPTAAASAASTVAARATTIMRAPSLSLKSSNAKMSRPAKSGKRLRDFIDGGPDSDSDEYDSDEEVWRKKRRPSRPLVNGATHISVPTTKGNSIPKPGTGLGNSARAATATAVPFKRTIPDGAVRTRGATYHVPRIANGVTGMVQNAPSLNHRPPPPPNPAPQRPTTTVPKTDAEIERMAQKLKQSHTAGATVKLAPLPSATTAGRSSGTGTARKVSAATAARLPDLAAVSSETLFLRGLLAADLTEVKRGNGSRGGSHRNVPSTFSGLKQYNKHFEQLLAQEIYAQVQRQVSEAGLGTSFACTVSGIVRKDEYWEVSATVRTAGYQVLRKEDLCVVSLKNESSDEAWMSKDNRLALVASAERAANSEDYPVTMYMKLRSTDWESPMAASMHSRVKFYACTLSSIVPQLREVRALVNAHTLPKTLLLSILGISNAPAQKTNVLNQVPKDMREHIAAFNTGQEQAIAKCCGAMDSHVSINLIQGPPGTGKTHVICGILACLLHGNKFKRGDKEDLPPGHSGQGLRQSYVPKKRILVCAQSNAAIDELLGRLDRKGVQTSVNATRAAAMLRLGNLDAAHAAALSFHIDYVVDSLNGGQKGAATSGKDTPAALRAKLLDTVQKMSQIKQGNKGIRESMKQLEAQRSTLEKQLEKTRDVEGLRDVQRASRDVRRSVLRCAELCVCTLSAAGGDLANLMVSQKQRSRGTCTDSELRFDAVIIDEAAQAIEPASLIPLYSLNPIKGQVVLVGDPQQLPPTVMSGASGAALKQSLFERLTKSGHAATMLKYQYRMHPELSRFPSAYFYSGDLQDGVTAKDRTAVYHSRGGRSGSFQNWEEVKLLITMLNFIYDKCKPEDVGSVAIISPYSAQVMFIKEHMKKDLIQYKNVSHFIEVATVDAYQAGTGNIDFLVAKCTNNAINVFQGREADIVIFSCVRAPKQGSESVQRSSTSGIGFLEDVRRLNVAITRARKSLWVLGHLNTLCNSKPWRKLAEHADARQVLLQAVPVRRSNGSGSSSSYSRMLAGNSPEAARLP